MPLAAVRVRAATRVEGRAVWARLPAGARLFRAFAREAGVLVARFERETGCVFFARVFAMNPPLVGAVFLLKDAPPRDEAQVSAALAAARRECLESLAFVSSTGWTGHFRSTTPNPQGSRP